MRSFASEPPPRPTVSSIHHLHKRLSNVDWFRFASELKWLARNDADQSSDDGDIRSEIPRSQQPDVSVISQFVQE